MQIRQAYNNFVRPTWAPPASVFGPVWTVLYILIAISYSYVGKLFFTHAISLSLLLPFILNLIFNFLYIPIQFGLKNKALASVDIVLVLATLVWTLIAIYPHAAWVAYINIPYLAWVAFATVLQFSITFLDLERGRG